MSAEMKRVASPPARGNTPPTRGLRHSLRIARRELAGARKRLAQWSSWDSGEWDRGRHRKDNWS